MTFQKDFYRYSEFYWLIFWMIQIGHIWLSYPESQYLPLNLFLSLTLLIHAYRAFFKPKHRFSKTRTMWLVIALLLLWLGAIVIYRGY
ncbi:hypothetical protein ACEF15_00815 [Streptococcus suis]